MKIFYILLNIIFIAVATLAFEAYFSGKPEQDLLVKKKKNKTPVKTTAIRKPSTKNIPKTQMPDTTVLVKNNLFTPDRGQEAETEEKSAASAPSPHPELKLVGVCSFGKIQGAIILENNRRAPVRRTGTNKQEDPPKRFYLLGEQLDNGFTLKQVNEKSVVLNKGSDQIVLPLEKNNKQSPTVSPVRPAPTVNRHLPNNRRLPNRDGRR